MTEVKRIIGLTTIYKIVYVNAIDQLPANTAIYFDGRTLHGDIGHTDKFKTLEKRVKSDLLVRLAKAIRDYETVMRTGA